jgi:hypothetical protein
MLKIVIINVNLVIEKIVDEKSSWWIDGSVDVKAVLRVA